MRIDAPVTEATSDYERKQVVKLKTGLYAGLFARYSIPKQYQKFNEEGTEEKFFVSFVVTHDAAANQLPYFSEAFAGIRTKIYYDAQSGRMSSYVALLNAIGGSELNPDKILELAHAGSLPDLDELIGRPALLFITPSPKADKNGLFANKIDTMRGGFDKVNPAVWKAIKPIWQAAEYETGDNAGQHIRYLAKPVTAYQEDVDAVEGRGYSSAEDDRFSEIPF